MKKALASILTFSLLPLPSFLQPLPAWALTEAVRVGDMQLGGAGVYGGQGSASNQASESLDMASRGLWESVAAGAGSSSVLLPQDLVHIHDAQQPVPSASLSRAAGVVAARDVSPIVAKPESLPETLSAGEVPGFGPPTEGTGRRIGARLGGGEVVQTPTEVVGQNQGLLPKAAQFVKELAPKGKEEAASPLAARSTLNGGWDNEAKRVADTADGTLGPVVAELRDAPSRPVLDAPGRVLRAVDGPEPVAPAPTDPAAAAGTLGSLALPFAFMDPQAGQGPSLLASIQTGDWSRLLLFGAVGLFGLGAYLWKKYHSDPMASPAHKAQARNLLILGAALGVLGAAAPYLALLTPVGWAFLAATALLAAPAVYYGWEGQKKKALIWGGFAAAAGLTGLGLPYLGAAVKFFSSTTGAAVGLGVLGGIATVLGRKLKRKLLTAAGVALSLASGAVWLGAGPYLAGLWSSLSAPAWSPTVWALIAMGSMLLAPFASFIASRRARLYKGRILLLALALLAPFAYFSYHKPGPGEVQVVETRWGGAYGPYGSKTRHLPYLDGFHFTIPLLHNVRGVDIRPTVTQNTVVIPASDLNITLNDQAGPGKRALKEVRIDVKLEWSVGPEHLMEGLRNIAEAREPVEGVSTDPKTPVSDQITNPENLVFYNRVIDEIKQKLKDDFLKVIEQEKARGAHLDTARMIQLWMQVRSRLADSEYYKARAKELYRAYSIDITGITFDIQLRTRPLP